MKVKAPNRGCWPALWLAVFILLPQGGSAQHPAAGDSSLLAQAFAGPMKHVQYLVFCTRLRYDDPHWYANIGYYCEDERQKAYSGNGQPDEARHTPGATRGFGHCGLSMLLDE